MNDYQLAQEIAQYNEQLKRFGWNGGIQTLLDGCSSYGHLYEEKYVLEGLEDTILPTPMNCFAVIAKQKPDFVRELIEQSELDQFLVLTTNLAMCLEIAVSRIGFTFDF